MRCWISWRRASPVSQRADQSRRAVGDDFDTWGGVLTGRDYQQFSSTTCIRSSMACCGKRRPPRAGDSVHQRRWSVAGSDGGDRLRCVGSRLDHRYCRCPPSRGNKVALQGNMDPSMLYASARVLKKKWRPFLPALAGKATSLTWTRYSSGR